MPRRHIFPLLLLTGLLGGFAASASAGVRVLRLGPAPLTPRGATSIGLVADGTPLRLTVALTPRNAAALAAYANAVSEPGSAEFHQYLTVAEFARRFGATPAVISAVRASLRSHGLIPGTLSANGLSLSVDTTAAAAERAFNTSLRRMALRGGAAGFTNASPPALDPSIAGDVQAIVGLSDLVRPHPLGLTTKRPSAHRAHAASDTNAVAPCPAAMDATNTTADGGAYTADQIAAAYDFGGLYAGGDEGAGETVGVYELESNFPSDITAYEACFGATGTVTYDPVDGGGGIPSAAAQSGVETELDAENVLGLAPKANVVIYQGPNTEQGGIATYEAIISQDVAKVVTTSWGDCEPDLDSGTVNAESTLFQEAAAQGQTIVAASGDDGVQDCEGDGSSQPNTAAAVDDPASQPFVTGVGGTSLSASAPRSETVWNNGPLSVSSGGGASGGGDSTLWQMPGYQASALSALNVKNAESSSTSCHTSTDCREVPDVSADADPSTGYLVYWNGNGSDTDSSAWISVGGTSGAAPVWAALFTLADDQTGCPSLIGFANPDLYAAAGKGYAADFYDITSGDNDWLDTNGGQFAAGPGFDQATGLGSPIASSLAAALCSEAPLTIGTPDSQASTAGASVSLQLTASESYGVTWAATGLPAGLSVDPATGVISGTPTTAGSSIVAIDAADRDGRVAGTHFQWTIDRSRITLSAPGERRGEVGRRTGLRLRAGDPFAAHLIYDVFGLPRGLTFSSGTGRISGVPRRRGTYRVRVVVSASNATSATETFTWKIRARPVPVSTGARHRRHRR